METINIYAINLNPSGTAQNSSVCKSETVNSVFKSYKETFDSTCELGEVILFSFRPKDNGGYTSFVEEFIDISAKKPCILIFNSLTDLANIVNVACTRLNRYIHNEDVRAIYFSDYCTNFDVTTYLDKLATTFNQEAVFQRDKFKKAPRNEKLREAILALRNQTEPVIHEDIANTLGMPPSTVRSLKSYSDGKNYRVRGRHITENEKEHLLIVKKEVEEALFQSVEIFEETYIK